MSDLQAQYTFTDLRDSTTYQIVKIGDQRWFKSNLRYKTQASWCAQNPDSKACLYGNYYYPEELIEVCPPNWRVPSWFEYKKALKVITNKYDLEDSVKYETGPVYNKKSGTKGERVTGITLINDTTFFDMVANGWIQGKKWKPQKQTSMWVVKDLTSDPQPHLHIRNGAILMHTHKHHVDDKPRKQRRFSVRCVSGL